MIRVVTVSTCALTLALATNLSHAQTERTNSSFNSTRSFSSQSSHGLKRPTLQRTSSNEGIRHTLPRSDVKGQRLAVTARAATQMLAQDVKNFYADVCHYNSESKRRYPRYFRDGKNPRTPTSVVGQKIEKERIAGTVKSPPVIRNRMRIYGTPEFRKMDLRRRTLAARVKKEMRGYKRGDPKREALLDLRRKLGPRGEISDKLDTAYVKMTIQFPWGGLLRDIARDNLGTYPAEDASTAP